MKMLCVKVEHACARRVTLSGDAFQAEQGVSYPWFRCREVPWPAGESAGLRKEAVQIVELRL